jgi:hypothetical protein
MMSKETILAMLQDGKDADAIAQEFVANLNAAIDEKKNQEEANKKEEEKRLRAEQLAQDILTFVHDFFPDLELGGLIDLTKGSDKLGNELIEVFESASAEIKQMKPFLDSLIATAPKDKIQIAKEDPIADFLKASGLM